MNKCCTHQKYIDFNKDVHKIVTEGILNQNNDINSGLIGSCIGGHINIVKKIINSHNNIDIDILESAFTQACIGGFADIVTILIEQGVTNLEDGFIISCEKGHLELVEILCK